MLDDDDLEEKPLTPEVERVRRKLMRLMLFSVAITMILILAVLGAVIYKVMQPTGQEVVKMSATTGPIPPYVNQVSAIDDHMLQKKIHLPVGSTILAHSLSGNYLSLYILAADKTTKFLIYDFNLGQFIAKVDVETTP